ncbi:DUF4232 domain-containing protein [Streptomyces piniterrae]|uniref:DUF4232 domain-containing protein n=1 Tax=Streptomyces piniterrae TaxID=2571125 RepID=A0A4U0NP00_9ACTN|nr:DUF4232 domain-containing protein [Streptomyces piniterrae]TJZ56060.1 DUF4232 domain-containing protein [Streptomyces piniterrae]
MRRRSLLAATAALTLTVTLGLGLIGCGSPRMAALHADCTTKNLRWKLTLLKKKPHSAQRDARLSSINKGPGACVFRGFPVFAVHVGKGPMSDGKGRGQTMPIDLRRGGTVTTALRYKDSDRATQPEGCLVSNDTAVVGAPRDTGYGRPITARDEAGRRAQMNICEDVVWMSPPKEVAE